AVENNSEGFNHAPVSGGLKIAKTRGLTVKDSAFLRNNGPGLWTDQSVYDIDVTGSDFVENAGAGVFLELSQKVDFIDNLVLRNKGNAIKINNTGGVKLLHNTIIGGDRVLNIVQDELRSDDSSVPVHNPLMSFPDTMIPLLL